MFKTVSVIFRRWVNSTDKIQLFIILTLLSFGVLVSIASTPAVAVKIGLQPFYFIKQHLAIVPVSIAIILYVSMLKIRYIKLLSLLGYIACIVLIICTFSFGMEIKGARRWLNIWGFSLQPSEFLKPTLTIVTAWLISEQYRDRSFPGIILSFATIFITVPILLLQPDVGMTVIILGTWLSQLFISGLSISMIITYCITAISAIISLYFLLPHFADRIDKFLFGGIDESDTYQVKRSLEAFKNGGLLGKGPGEGVIKTAVPDSHSDFVFSVIGEEFGFITCVAVIALFVSYIIRVLTRIMKSSDMFQTIAGFGILCQILLQTLINIGTSLNLIPTKGMTLPFISYGGSSMLATSISVGIVLCLTKRQNVLQN
ncbi:MAG: cell division protein FtsW [Alphaproteobacteria bacterium]|nr:cell division protein FtsW [Alphaproteobacteria bacterium]